MNSILAITIISVSCFCKSEDEFNSSPFLSKYLFYDVNPAEGFNLRRDIYMRLAVFMKSLTSSSNGCSWRLVLPPWPHLYHWQSFQEIGFQNLIPWSYFFDIDSMRRFVDVIEMHQVLNEIASPTLDITLVLQNYKDAFTDSWSWDEKWEFADCHKQSSSRYKLSGKNYEGYFWGYGNVTSKELFCISYQGSASKLKEIIESVDRRLIMIDHAEVVLHDLFGGSEYWRCRRSMRFSSALVEAANDFRNKYLNSTDETDKTIRPDKWEDEIPQRNALGGPYLGVHLRRRDFEYNRKDEIPTLEQAAKHISHTLVQLQLSKVFIATDGPATFVEGLKRSLPNYQVYFYDKSKSHKKKYGDGGLAIIDQIINSHARYFIGSYESTFSFRIQEEREILGFPVDTTFNRFCGSQIPCTQPSKWTIVF